MAESVATTTLIDCEPDAPGKFRGALSDVRVFNSTGWPVVVVRIRTSADGCLPIGVQVMAQPWRWPVLPGTAQWRLKAVHHPVFTNAAAAWKAPRHRNTAQAPWVSSAQRSSLRASW
jgi:Asp-tRNA(Asn)/Glu-tRNA(Gln) amidotransferase A subunit family amidase